MVRVRVRVRVRVIRVRFRVGSGSRAIFQKEGQSYRARHNWTITNIVY